MVLWPVVRFLDFKSILCAFKKNTLNYKLIKMNPDHISCLLGNRCKPQQFGRWNTDRSIDKKLETRFQASLPQDASASGVYPRSLWLNCALESEKCFCFSIEWDYRRQWGMACSFSKISQTGARGESRNKNRCVSMHNQKGFMYIILVALFSGLFHFSNHVGRWANCKFVKYS